jgi:hypothetical protein
VLLLQHLLLLLLDLFLVALVVAPAVVVRVVQVGLVYGYISSVIEAPFPV